MAPRTCPHCLKQIPVDEGFYFDEKMNLICENCDKIALSVEEMKEIKIPVEMPKNGQAANNFRI